MKSIVGEDYWGGARSVLRRHGSPMIKLEGHETPQRSFLSINPRLDDGNYRIVVQVEESPKHA